MQFEVVRNGVVVMTTSSPECIPDADTLKAMKKAGYKLLLDGKPYRKGGETTGDQ